MTLFKKIYLLVPSTLAAFLVFGCGGGDGSSNSHLSNVTDQLEWIAYGGNPVITMGQNMGSAQWNDPSVIKIDLTYTMYLAVNSILELGKKALPFRSTSIDGTNWTIDTTPLLALGNPGEFDETGIETPSVIFFNGKYHMYYTGVGIGGLSGSLSVGHASSID